jgi:cyclic beta-1,2-glucan synthetase
VGTRFPFSLRRAAAPVSDRYRVVEQQLDGSCYDLLASEARLTSLLAIARGDVPVDHWAALGRPFYAAGAHAGLRSWSGSMFEYLLPSLLLAEPQGSVLQNATRAAIREQIAFGRARRMPWGISESAYAARDQTLAYQYSAHGVPRLALRRTPRDELALAPYATALAAPYVPHRAVANFRRLERLGARGRYGFFEALDFTPSRQADRGGPVRVATFMAHHQGMTLVALADLLLAGTPRRWAMGEPRIEAVASLLHERAPREVMALPSPPPGPAPEVDPQRGLGVLHKIVPEGTSVLPTQLLSNGRYSLAIRGNGAGWSRWGRIGITRWRDDALRDAYGSFFYLRRERDAPPVSLTSHPAPDPAARYECVHHADRACFTSHWSDLDALVTVWVSAEDDIEFRRVELSNRSDRVLDVELISAFEATLAEHSADEAHPAFSNLFVSARWLAAHGALLFDRAPRLPTEQAAHVAHFLAYGEPQVAAIRIETDRARWLGRNGEPRAPLAAFGEPAALGDANSEGATLDTGLDPLCAMSARVRIAPQSTARLVFCTAASDDRATLVALIDKYRQSGPVERASMMSATLTAIRVRDLQIGAENFAAIQTLTTALVSSLTRAGRPSRSPEGKLAEADTTGASDRRDLWRLGISGDRPIVLASARNEQGVGLLRTLAQALRVWSWGGVGCDLVMVNAEPRSYSMPLQREIAALSERYFAEIGASPTAPTVAGFHTMHADDLTADESRTLRALARIEFEADGRPLHHHVQDWLEPHDEALAARRAVARSNLPTVAAPSKSPGASRGSFAEDGREFAFDVKATERPRRPWVNVIANPEFGAQISEAGGGYTWAKNSRMNQLTPWSNDPVADTAGEWWLLQDTKTHEIWSITPSASGDAKASYRVAHGQGYTVISHRHRDLDVEATWCVDPQASVKEVRVRLTNRGARTLLLRAVVVAEWQLGGARRDRATVTTSRFQHPLRAGGPSRDGRDAAGAGFVAALLATQRERSAGFAEGTAFLATTGASADLADWTCDRRECFDARGFPVVPTRYARRDGGGLDPCAAMALPLRIDPGANAEYAFLLGFGADAEAAQALAVEAASAAAAQRLERARAQWASLLGAMTVQTPDPLFDAMVNRWLLYQTVSCRLWAKAGFYQAGGAFGFRDQLQDAMALAWAAPERLRQQIVLSAVAAIRGRRRPALVASTDRSRGAHALVRRFVVAAVRVRPLRSVHGRHGLAGRNGALRCGCGHSRRPRGCVLRAHRDRERRDRLRALRAGDRPQPCGRRPRLAVDRHRRLERRHEPSRPSGAWRVRVARMVPVPAGRRLCADRSRPRRRRAGGAVGKRRARLAPGVAAEAWDGEWYKRAFFDDGTPLGSHVNRECRIDLIAQAWAVMFERGARHEPDHRDGVGGRPARRSRPRV